MKETEIIRRENEVLRKQIEYLLLIKSQEKGIKRLDFGYANQKIKVLMDEELSEDEKLSKYLSICQDESEVRVRALNYRVQQIRRFRRENLEVWHQIISMRF